MPKLPRRHDAVTVAATLLALAAGHFAASRVPSSVGWENGLVENVQVGLLLAGGLLALRHGRAHGSGRDRTFWFLMVPLWFVLAARELSWGACFLPPYAFDPGTGPKFSSSVQLWYRPAVPYLLAAVLGMLLLRFVQTGQFRFLTAVHRQGHLPVVQLGCAALCMLASGAAEGHLLVDLGFETQGAAQTFEELSETCAYAMVLLAQWRVSCASTARASGPAATPGA